MTGAELEGGAGAACGLGTALNVEGGGTSVKFIESLAVRSLRLRFSTAA